MFCFIKGKLYIKEYGEFTGWEMENLHSWLPLKLSWWLKSLCVVCHQALVKAKQLLPFTRQAVKQTVFHYTLFFKPTSSQRKELVWGDPQEVRFILERVQRSLHPVALGSHLSGKVSSQLPFLHLLPAVLPSYPRTGGGGRARTTCVHQLRVTPSAGVRVCGSFCSLRDRNVPNHALSSPPPFR